MSAGADVLRFDLPPTAAVANLTGALTGIQRLVARPPTESSATVIDTSDHRLLDWGVELSRITETGQWVLRVPAWAPPLQAEYISPQAEDELPADMAAILVPIRRGGILGPKLKVETLRRRFQLVGAEGATIGELTDERHKVSSHAGQMTSYRNVTLRLPAPSPEQLQAIVGAFEAAGGAQVDSYDTLATRLELAHHAKPRSALSARAPIEDFVAAQFESRWRRLLLADLTTRTGTGDDTPMRQGVLALRSELAGLESLLDPDWVRAAEQLAETAAEATRPLQNTERWLRILDLLAQGSLEPPLHAVAGRITGPVLAQELEAVVHSMLDQCRTLEPYSEDARWTRAHQVAARASALSTLARDVFGKPAKQLRKNLQPIVDGLTLTLRPEVEASRDLHSLSVTEVFEAGRAYERSMLSIAYARENFVREWPGWWDRLRGRMIRPRVPHTPARPGPPTLTRADPLPPPAAGPVEELP